MDLEKLVWTSKHNRFFSSKKENNNSVVRCFLNICESSMLLLNLSDLGGKEQQFRCQMKNCLSTVYDF